MAGPHNAWIAPFIAALRAQGIPANQESSPVSGSPFGYVVVYLTPEKWEGRYIMVSEACEFEDADGLLVSVAKNHEDGPEVQADPLPVGTALQLVLDITSEGWPEVMPIHERITDPAERRKHYMGAMRALARLCRDEGLTEPGDVIEDVAEWEVG